MIELKNSHFVIDGQPFYVYSGEIHYFRIKPSLWAKHLKRAKEAGLNTVSSYIPWSWHEAKEGEFDFEGLTHPQKNLISYLKLVKKFGLKFIARVGPVSNAEMVNEGIPGWLLENHSDVFVHGKEVTNLPHVTLLSYHNKTFQSYVGKWYKKLLPVIKQNQHPLGGIIAVQLDNEIGMVHWLNKAADYSPGTERMYKEYLESIYSGIGELNKSYGTSYGSFSEVSQPPSGDDTQNRQMLWDWMGFYQRYYALYFESLHKMYKSEGLSLPVLANIPQFYDFDVRGRGIYSPMTTMMFRDFHKLVPDAIFGGAYQMRRLDYENFHDIAITSEVVKMITTPGIPSICAELQTGIMRDRPKLYPADVELNLKTSIAHGLNALNCYMFSGGKNEPEFGAFGTYHGWQAAVTPDGAQNRHFSVMEDFGALIKTWGGGILNTKKHSGIAVGFYAPIYTTEYLSGKDVDNWEWKKAQLFYDGAARLMQLANINFTFLDLQDTDLEELLKHPSLWVFSLEFMDSETQNKLLQYVKLGGKLVINPYLPEYDLSFKKCALLADGLGIKCVSKTNKHMQYYIDGRDFLAQGELCAYSYKSAVKADVIARDAGNNACALMVSAGNGRAVVIGFGLNHMFDYHVRNIEYFLNLVCVNASIKVDMDVSAVLRKNESSGFLFISNYHDDIKKTAVKLILPGESKPTVMPSRGNITLGNRKSYMLPLNLQLTPEDVIRYSTVEILEYKLAGRKLIFTVQGTMGSQAEIQLKTTRKRAHLGSHDLKPVYRSNRLTISFVTDGKRQSIVVG